MLVFPVKSQLAAQAHWIAAEAADIAALLNNHGQPRRDPQQLVRCELKALAQLLKGDDRCVSLPSGNTAEVSWAETAELRGLLVAETTAAA